LKLEIVICPLLFPSYNFLNICIPRLKDVPETVNIYCAIANPIEVIFVESEQGRAVLGVADGLDQKA
jgi:adenosine/AMP kinase